MGLFDNKYVVNTGTVVSPLLGERPNLVRAAIIKATINDLPYVPTIVEALLSGYNIDPRAFYKKGEDQSYRLGLPLGNIPKIQDRTPEAKQVIAELEGIPVEDIQFNTDPIFDALSDDFLGRIYTQQIYEDDISPETGISLIQGRDTNNIPASKVAEYSSARLLKNRGDDFEIKDRAAIDATIDLRIEYKVYDPTDRVNTETILVTIYPLTAGNSAKFYSIKDWGVKLYGSSYQLPDGAGGFLAEKYWAYDPSTDLYPTLAIFDDEDLGSPYFPIVPIRVDKQMVGDADHELSLYRNEEFVEEIEDMLGLVGADLEGLQTALADNPDLDDIDDSYLVFALPLGLEHGGSLNNSTTEPAILRYLYKYFRYLHDRVQTYDQQEFKASLQKVADGIRKEPFFNVIRIDSVQLKQTLYWNYIKITEEPWTPKNTGGRKKSAYRQSGVANVETDPREEGFYAKGSIAFWYYDDELEKCTKINIDGLYLENDVIRGNSVVNTIHDSFSKTTEAPKDGLYIPLAYKTLITMSKRDQDIVSFASIVLVTYAVVVTKIKWYLRTSFLNLLRIVIFIVAIFTANPALLTLDLAVSEIAYIIIESIIINYLTGAAVSFIFSALVDLIGLDAAIILAVIAIAYGAAVEIGAISPIDFLPDAATILQAGSALAQATSEKIRKDTLGLYEEFKELTQRQKEQKEEIDALGFTTDIGIDINDVVQSIVFRPERPDSFFRRTINPSGGLSTLDTVNYYYDNVLSTNLENI